MKSFITLITLSLFLNAHGEAKTEVVFGSSSVLNLTTLEDNEISLKVLYPGINPGWGICGIEISAWDAAPEFNPLFDSLEFELQGVNDKLQFEVSSQEPQGWIKVDFAKSSGAYLLNLNIKTKTGESFSTLSKRIFKERSVQIYPITCDPA
jgi:hypothetical protein